MKSVKSVGYLLAAIWGGYVLQKILAWEAVGLRPREWQGLWGIVFSPFLHGSIVHLLANSMSLIVVGFLFFSTQGKRAIPVLAEITVLSGLGTWLIGRSGSIHIGASGVIYGLIGYTFLIGYYQRDLKNILLSLMAFSFYGGALWGLLPLHPQISWEGHLCGFLAGVGSAKWGKK